MNPTYRFPAPTLFAAALLAAFLLPFLPGCSKTPEDHARIASDPGVRFEKSMASVQALAEANDQMLLAGVAAASRNPDIRRAAADRLDEPRAMAAFAKKVRPADGAGGAELAAEVMGKTGDRRLVADIAANAASVFVRIEAAALLDDQAALADIARGARSPDVILKVVEKLADQAALSSIAKTNAAQERLWGPALDKLDGQPLLAALARDAARHPALGARAAGKLRDQAVLEEIARSALPDAVRKAAISGLTNQRALADIAGNDPDTLIRLAATGRLTDQQALAAIAKSDAGKNVRLKAVERLADQRTLAGLVENAGFDENDPGEEIPSAALKKITDRQALAVIAKKAGLPSLRSEAVERLDDQRLLAELARNDHEQSVRHSATGRLDDQRLLAGIARDDEDDAVREQAISRLTDQNTLADIAKNHKASDTAWAALKKLDDPHLLAETAASSRHGEVRVGALEEIKNPPVLDSLARREDAEPETRLLAVWRLADKPLLAELAKNAPDERVRRAAASKLSANAPRTLERGKLADLINEGKLLAQINGDNIRNMNIVLRKLAPHPLEVTIPAGSYFVCDNPNAQNMVSTADVTLTLRGDSQSTDVPVACANKPKDIPGKHDSFTLGALPDAGELEKLMAVLGRKNVSYHTKQAAVWIVTDNADYGDLGALRTVSQYTPRIPGVAYGTRSIEEPEAAEAMRLCDEAGIDIKTKSIWHDCEKILAGLKAGELKNWLKKSSGLASPAHRENVTMLAISSDGRLLVSGDDSGEIKLWSLPDGAFVRALKAHGRNVDCLAISPDGAWLVSGDNGDSYMKLWHLPDGRLAKDAGLVERRVGDNLFQARIASAAFGPDGKWFVTGDNDGFIKLWRLPGCELVRTLERQVTAEGNGISLDVLALSADGGLLAAGGADNAVKLWRLPDGAPAGALEGHQKFLRFAAIGQDGKQLVSGSDDRVVNVWSLPDGALLKTLKEIEAQSAAVSPDGKLLAATEPPKGTRRGGLPLSGFHASLRRLPDGEIVTRFEGLTLATMRCSAITPGNALLATGDGNGNIKLWSLPDGKLIKTLESE
ncbi:MAG: hypothetical protein LBC18_10180 [Opitutaceae bacterium]|jgi:WD40 repeat protein|nr:hypothetical protein [Opitutaceae bacterium]